MNLEDTPEYQQSLRMRPACDAVLCDVFGVQPEAIERFSKASDLFVLDQQFAIDLRIRLNNGTQLTGQEKALSHRYCSYRTFTVEFWQNRFTREPEEFFKIASHFYHHEDSDEKGLAFIEWKIIDVLKFIDWLKVCGLDKLESKVRPAGGSRAAFLPIPYDKIPKQFILSEWRRE